MNGDAAAFPTDDLGIKGMGLTKREYFIGRAMQGLLASSNFRSVNELGRNAVVAADATLAAADEDAS